MVFVGCSSSKVNSDLPINTNLQGSKWETKALVRNLKNKKSNTLDIDVLCTDRDVSRIEVSAFLGMQLASIFISSEKIKLALYSEKKFYYGKYDPKTLENIIGIPLSPFNFLNIANDKPIKDSGWICKQNNNGLPDQCQNSDKSISISWTDRNQGEKKVSILSPNFEMVWFFKSLQTQVQFKYENFNLKQPDGFKAIHIN